MSDAGRDKVGGEGYNGIGRRHPTGGEGLDDEIRLGTREELAFLN